MPIQCTISWQTKRIIGWLYLPAGPVRAFALFVHRLGNPHQDPRIQRLAHGFVDEGIAALVVALPINPHSTPDADASDILGIIGWMQTYHQAPAILLGHAKAGIAAVSIADNLPECVVVATLATPCGYLLYRSSQFEKPLMVFHDDSTGTPSDSRYLLLASQNPLGFMVFAQSPLTDPRAMYYIASTTARAAQSLLPDYSRIDAVRRSTISYVQLIGDGMACEVYTDGHLLRADTSPHAESIGTGPSPYHYLLSGLGACTAITLRNYANHHQWPLETITVKLRHEQRRVTKPQPGSPSRIDVISRAIALTGPLSPAHRRECLAVANQCPMHLTLQYPQVIHTLLEPC